MLRLNKYQDWLFDYTDKTVGLYLQRKQVVTGGTEPTDEECDWPSDDEKEELSVRTSPSSKVCYVGS